MTILHCIKIYFEKFMPAHHSVSQPLMLYVASFSELWERFSFYIVEALLVVYLIEAKHLSQSYSYELLGTYISNSFILTIIGGYLGQKVLGFREAVNLGALLMSIGYALLLDPNINYLYHGLALIVVGSAFFKPNMACFVGSLYKIKTGARYFAGYNTYYASIMLGVILSTSISGYILHYFGWDTNFSLASLCMMFAFGIFWIGNKFSPHREYTHNDPIASHKYRYVLTFGVVIFLWMLMHLLLRNAFAAQIELVICLFIVFCYLCKEAFGLSKDKRLHFFACIILMIFSCIYWALLFQLFFSLNLMVKLVVNRHLLNFQLPSPLFMGIESVFVIIFSVLLGKAWAMAERKKLVIGLFTKYMIAFFACLLGFVVLIVAFQTSLTPYFPWVILSYACIGLGEAILAPTALAMIAQLNSEQKAAMMMAILYVFWGFGTKIADQLAQWSIFPSTLNDAVAISPYFSHAVMEYAGLSFGMVVLALLGRWFFRI